ncbi:MAG: hypothetical protein QW175_00455 [Candidatus Bathyarchaeia archaeon]
MRHLALGLVAGVLLTIFFYLIGVAHESLQALLVFNIFFVCMYFPLNGPLRMKMLVLIAGNFAYLVWSMLLSMFTAIVAAQVSDGLNVFLAFLNMMLNLLWVVSFWSISLTFLVKYRRGGR